MCLRAHVCTCVRACTRVRAYKMCICLHMHGCMYNSLWNINIYIYKATRCGFQDMNSPFYHKVHVVCMECVRVCVYLCVCACMYMCVFVWEYGCLYMCLCVWCFIRVCVYMICVLFILMRLCTLYKFDYLCDCMYVHVSVHDFARAHARLYVCGSSVVCLCVNVCVCKMRHVYIAVISVHIYSIYTNIYGGRCQCR